MVHIMDLFLSIQKEIQSGVPAEETTIRKSACK
jgi:hypothetical protein